MNTRVEPASMTCVTDGRAWVARLRHHKHPSTCPFEVWQRSRPNDRAHGPLGLVRLSPGPGMRGCEDLSEVVDGHERVDLSGGHRGMAEQLLDDAHVGAP